MDRVCNDFLGVRTFEGNRLYEFHEQAFDSITLKYGELLEHLTEVFDRKEGSKKLLKIVKVRYEEKVEEIRESDFDDFCIRTFYELMNGQLEYLRSFVKNDHQLKKGDARSYRELLRELKRIAQMFSRGINKGFERPQVRPVKIERDFGPIVVKRERKRQPQQRKRKGYDQLYPTMDWRDEPRKRPSSRHRFFNSQTGYIDDLNREFAIGSYGAGGESIDPSIKLTRPIKEQAPRKTNFSCKVTSSTDRKIPEEQVMPWLIQKKPPGTRGKLQKIKNPRASEWHKERDKNRRQERDLKDKLQKQVWEYWTRDVVEPE